MARNGFLSEHKTWEDWALLVLGGVIMVSPWIVEQETHGGAVSSAAITGFLTILLGGFELLRLYRWEELASLLCGLWLMISPYMLGYANVVPLAAVHVGLGLLVTLIALLQIWQDWRYSDDELEHRPH